MILFEENVEIVESVDLIQEQKLFTIDYLVFYCEYENLVDILKKYCSNVLGELKEIVLKKNAVYQNVRDLENQKDGNIWVYRHEFDFDVCFFVGIPGSNAKTLFKEIFTNFPSHFLRPGSVAIKRIDCKFKNKDKPYYGKGWQDIAWADHNIFFRKQTLFNENKKKPFLVQQLSSRTGITTALNGRQQNYFIRFCTFPKT